MIGPLRLVVSAPAHAPTLAVGGGPVAVGGTDQATTAILTVDLLRRGVPVVLTPTPDIHPVTGGLVWDGQWRPATTPPPTTEAGWDLAFYTSGSSTGQPHLYAFTRAQLAHVALWYRDLYHLTSDSLLITAMPATYNFTAVAGVLAASVTGARLELATDPGAALERARTLAPHHDRCVILANPVMLQHAADHLVGRLPGNVLIDSGGAPLSTTAITLFREHVADLREGYGLTETGSLTHFDVQGSADSLGTVGAAVPGCTATVASDAAAPLLSITSPAVGRQITPEGHLGPERTSLTTTDLARIDPHGRLRLLGRADDTAVNGLWPRDTLDLIGPALGTRCALVRHPRPDRITVRLLDGAKPLNTGDLRRRIADATSLTPQDVQIDVEQQRVLLHSHKLPRHTAGHHQ
ncbi:AMP-binding protein [Nocardiopsis terrae]|uniref:AMP-binding protein n=1 Tax=Streptomyces sp. NPDC057554 TaxID=3350538 RepID=UPI0036B13F2B